MLARDEARRTEAALAKSRLDAEAEKSRWADEVARLAGLRIPLAPTFGLLAFTPPVATCLRRVVRAPQCHMRPDGAGRLMFQMDDADATVGAETEPSPALPAAPGLRARPGCPGRVTAPETAAGAAATAASWPEW